MLMMVLGTASWGGVGLPSLLPISFLFTGSHFLEESTLQLPFAHLDPAAPQTHNAFLDISTWQPEILSPKLLPLRVLFIATIPCSPGLNSVLESSPSPKASSSRDADLILPRGGCH